MSNPLALVVTHLNASIGACVSEKDLASALLDASLARVDNPLAAAVLATLFVEVRPALIARCGVQVGVGLIGTDQLYRHLVSAGSPRVRAWEDAVAHVAA